MIENYLRYGRYVEGIRKGNLRRQCKFNFNLTMCALIQKRTLKENANHHEGFASESKGAFLSVP